LHLLQPWHTWYCSVASQFQMSDNVDIEPYQGIVTYEGIRLSSSINGLIKYAETNGQIASKKLVLSQLIKDAATAASLKILVNSTVAELTTVASRLIPIISLREQVSAHEHDPKI
jgi:hypothetical protein